MKVSYGRPARSDRYSSWERRQAQPEGRGTVLVSDRFGCICFVSARVPSLRHHGHPTADDSSRSRRGRRSRARPRPPGGLRRRSDDRGRRLSAAVLGCRRCRTGRSGFPARRAALRHDAVHGFRRGSGASADHVPQAHIRPGEIRLSLRGPASRGRAGLRAR